MNNEFKEALHRRIQEEQADAETYVKMSEMAQGHLGGVLRDIAHEEETHKRLLMEMMNDVQG